MENPMNSLAQASTVSQARAGRGRLAIASMVGTSLEWYDFTVYNTLAALVFNHLFFPSVDPLAGTLLAFSTYAVGYVSRPLGGFIFGNLGDRVGRRAVLMLTLMLMGLTTALMGVLPTYASAGILSPILLIALRFVQGVALGGEWAGAVLLAVEHGDQKKRRRSAPCSAQVSSPSSRFRFRPTRFSRGAGACLSSPVFCSSVSACGFAAA
jgi:MFS family permease